MADGLAMRLRKLRGEDRLKEIADVVARWRASGRSEAAFNAEVGVAGVSCHPSDICGYPAARYEGSCLPGGLESYRRQQRQGISSSHGPFGARPDPVAAPPKREHRPHALLGVFHHNVRRDAHRRALNQYRAEFVRHRYRGMIHSE
jgi:hypothetical protein